MAAKHRFLPWLDPLELRQLLSGLVYSSPVLTPNGLGIVPDTAVLADLNGDGKADLVVGGTEVGVPVLGVFLGKGNGTFGVPTMMPLGATPTAISTGNFDGHGHVDLVVAVPGTVDLFLNDGNGDFTLGASVAALGATRAMAVGDFNGDGNEDVLTVSDSQALLLLGDSSGNLTAQTSINLPFGSVSDVVAGDLNGDHHLDFAVVNQANDSVSVFLGNGDGTFQPPATYATGSSPSSIAIANFRNRTINGLPELDIVTADSASGRVSFLANQGDGTFAAPVDSVVAGSAVNGGPVLVRAVNLINGTQGVPGIVCQLSAGGATDGVALLGNGDGTFASGASLTLSGGATATGLAVGDLVGSATPHADVVMTGSAQFDAFISTPARAATHLAFVQQPGATVAGAVMAPAVTMNVLDSTNHLVVGASTVTLSLLAVHGGVLSGTTSVTAQNGVATFAGLSMTTSGTYTLVAVDGGLTTKSTSFVIVPDAASSRLVLGLQPTDTLVGKQLSPSFSAKAEDQFGNLVTGDHSRIILSTTQGTFSGASMVTLSGGSVVFTNIVFKTTGTYALAAAPATNSTLAIATPIDITVNVTRGVTASIPTPGVRASGYTYGSAVALTTRISSSAPASIPFAGAPTFDINGTDSGASVTFSVTGVAKFTLPRLDAGSYTCQIVYAGDANHTPGTSSAFPLTINAAPTTTTLAASTNALVFGQTVTLAATVKSSSAPGIPRPGNVEFLEDGAPLTTLALNGSSSASVTFTPTATGNHTYQAMYLATSDFTGSASAILKRTVNKDKTAILLAPSVASPIPQNQTFNLEVVVSVLAPGGGVVTGDQVLLRDNGKLLGTLTLDSAGTGLLSGLIYTNSGLHTLTGIFLGDPNTLPATAPSLKLTVN